MQLLNRNIAPLGMGCWAIGGEFFSGSTPLGFSNVDDCTSTRTIHAALDAGIRLFDTAAVYGAGHSERLLGAALKGRDDTIVISKLGTSFDEKTRQILGPERESGSVQGQIDGSLRRLDRDCIDIMLLHLNSLTVETARPIFEEMDKARLAGKIRAFGWSTDFPESVVAMSGMDGFIAVEHAMSVVLDVPTIQSTIEDKRLVALIRSPLAMGILTGKFSRDTTLAADDVRAADSDRREYFQGRKVASKYLDNLDVVGELLRSGGRSLAQGALCWLLAKSDRNIPIPGARTEQQVRENAGAAEFGPLPPEVMEEIESQIQREPEGPARAR